MKAIVYRNDGRLEVLRCEEIEKPSAGDDEVLIKVRAAAVNPLDYHLLGHPFARRLLFARTKLKSKRPGRDVAGEVEAVGSLVTEFKPGDAVFGWGGGAFAEYACTSESALAKKPEGVTFEQAASAPVAAITALQGLRDKGKIQPGQKVLINGASGGVGTFAVQIAKSSGADVTGVCSTRNVALVRSIGADRVIDYTREDFTENGKRYDLILDCFATHSLSAIRRVLNLRGRYVGVGGPVGSMIGMLAGQITQLVFSSFVSQKFVSFMANLNREDLAVLRGLMQAGKVKPVIDRRYRLSETPEAIRYLEEGHARGKVVITV
ncbi:MAG TPA: NAD(P)-dependent alcohol dehydrogenase [Pyrinomonadaceae bacterium]|nr:NAD(P)-dependent alcohol dehydrogenase [Pyrinomonadaceae bacterium]